jgi:hypothetical protein
MFIPVTNRLSGGLRDSLPNAIGYGYGHIRLVGVLVSLSYYGAEMPE